VVESEELDASVGPASLRAARGSYSRFIRHNLAHAQCEDLPRNGPYVVGGLAKGVSAGQLFREMGLREEAGIRLFETLIERGYVALGEGPVQHGVPDLVNTPRGEAAATAVGDAVHEVNELLVQSLSNEQLEGFLAGLESLSEIKEEFEERHHHAH
jgi:hypothetical protein